MSKIKLSEWAKKNAVCYRTAWNYFKKGKFDKNSEISDSGSIFILDNEICNSGNVFIYGRVSSVNKKEDLNSQVSLCEQFCLAKGWPISKIYKEVASGMNDNRKILNKILDNPPSKLVILHRDRLTQFGYNFIKKILEEKGCEIICINENKRDEEDLIKDFISIITNFCCRIYGARHGQTKALKMKELIND